MHRVAQFVGHLTARVGDDETALAHRALPTAAAALFDDMRVADRRHAIDVAQRLLARGLDDPDLIAAALLHDAAKRDGMQLWHRVVGVLLAALAPGLLRRVAAPQAGSWRHGFWLYLHHGPMSADAALAAGCTSRVAAFIRGAAEPSDAPLAAALAAADAAS